MLWQEKFLNDDGFLFAPHFAGFGHR